MPKVVVDIRTRMIPDDHRCYILFPGEGYRLHRAMQEENSIFLDYPGLPFVPGERFQNAKDLPKRVVVSERIKEFHDGGREGDEPVRTVKELGRHRVTDSRAQSAGRFLSFVTRLKAGDIVVVPGRDLDDEVLFGEILDNEIVPLKIERYGNDALPSRRVRWIKTVKRIDVPSWLERKIPSPNPLRQIEKTYFSAIFDIMYERYFFEGSFVCKFSVGSQEFSSLDNFLFQQIVLYAAALHENRMEDNIANLSKLPISVVASRIEFSEDIPDQRISINSPGHIVVYARNIIPIVAGALMTISAATGAVGDGELTVEIVNSVDKSAHSLECVADVQEEVLGDLNAMGYARWQELCEIESQARKRTMLDSGMSARTKR